MNSGGSADLVLGDLLQELVDRVSRMQGKTLTILTEESVTVQQVLLLRRVHQLGHTTPSQLAARMHISLPAVSQMVERLFQLKLLTRSEAPDDRRRKNLRLTARGRDVLARVSKARSAEYAAGVSGLSRKVRGELVTVLRRALEELPVEADAVVAATRAVADARRNY